MDLTRLIAILLCMLPILSVGQEIDTANTIRSIHRIGFVTDQDFFLSLIRLPNEDRNYTMGVGLPFYQSVEMADKWYFAPQRTLAAVILGKRANQYGYVNANIMLANTTFTPQYLGNLHDPEHEYQRENDRPFVSLNFITSNLMLLKDNGNTTLTIGMNVGAIGLNVSKAFQYYVHRNPKYNREMPSGWEGQISKGGEPTILITAKKDWLIVGRAGTKESKKIQINHFIETRLGYYIGAAYGFNVSFGKLNSRNWVGSPLPLNSTSKKIGIGNKSQTLYYVASNGFDKNKFELYFIGGARLNAWLYNALLMGQLKTNPYTFSFEEMNKLTFDWNVGLGFKIPMNSKSNKSIRTLVQLAGRSPEFNTVRTFERWHSWGDFQLYYEW
nr:lipid A-modifier LpxR family protein [uncultured Pedobacter sp.]